MSTAQDLARTVALIKETKRGVYREIIGLCVSEASRHVREDNDAGAEALDHLVILLRLRLDEIS